MSVRRTIRGCPCRVALAAVALSVVGGAVYWVGVGTRVRVLPAGTREIGFAAAILLVCVSAALATSVLRVGSDE